MKYVEIGMMSIMAVKLSKVTQTVLISIAASMRNPMIHKMK